jgi:hypothetical protein
MDGEGLGKGFFVVGPYEAKDGMASLTAKVLTKNSKQWWPWISKMVIPLMAASLREASLAVGDPCASPGLAQADVPVPVFLVPVLDTQTFLEATVRYPCEGPHQQEHYDLLMDQLSSTAGPVMNLFASLDQNRDSKLSKEEILAYFKNNIPDGFWKTDTDESGDISFDEFLTWYSLGEEGRRLSEQTDVQV